MPEQRPANPDATPELIPVAQDAAGETTTGCHAGGDTMARAAAEAGKSELLEQYARDYPRGPHDQPQSMCPAFGSLRVGLRMRRTATVLSGSACCVYGLTFTSHFYGARRTVGYVPFDSETLVTGKLFEDIRESVHQLADPAQYDAVVVINLCVPTASGVPLDLLPKEINGVRVIGIDVPGFGVPTHAEAKDVLAAAMLRYARTEVESGPVARPGSLSAREGRSALALAGENAARNRVGDRITYLEGDAFAVLESLRDAGERFDVVVLDPPAFIKRRRDFRVGQKGYSRLNRLAMRLLSREGFLVSCSCSSYLRRDQLAEILLSSARHLDRSVQLLEMGGQGPDHPVHPAIPETEYLKACFSRVLPA